MKLTDDQREELTKALSANWVNMHTNESLGRQRMLADAIAPLIEGWMSTPPPGWTEHTTEAGRTVWLSPFPPAPEETP